MLDSIRRILVPTDLSERSDVAIDSARALARADGAAVSLVHAVRLPVLHTPRDVNVPASIWDALTRRARESMYESQLRLEEAGVEEVDMVVKDVHPAEELIRRTAIEQKSDLIVMATHGRRGIGQALIGSVTARTLRVAPVPVLCVREQPLVGPPERLLVAVDFSSHSEAACEVAKSLAVRFEAAVDLMHAYDRLPDYLRFASREATEFEEDLRRAIDERLGEQSQVFARAGVPFTIRAVDDEPADAIARTAEELDSSLIVMGTAGRSGALNAMLGSVTERTLGRTTRPVLAVRAEAQT